MNDDEEVYVEATTTTVSLVKGWPENLPKPPSQRHVGSSDGDDGEGDALLLQGENIQSRGLSVIPLQAIQETLDDIPAPLEDIESGEDIIEIESPVDIRRRRRHLTMAFFALVAPAFVIGTAFGIRNSNGNSPEDDRTIDIEIPPIQVSSPSSSPVPSPTPTSYPFFIVSPMDGSGPPDASKPPTPSLSPHLAIPSDMASDLPSDVPSNIPSSTPSEFTLDIIRDSSSPSASTSPSPTPSAAVPVISSPPTASFPGSGIDPPSSRPTTNSTEEPVASPTNVPSRTLASFTTSSPRPSASPFQPSYFPTIPPSLAPTESFVEVVRDILQPISYAPKELDDPDSPASIAINWLASVTTTETATATNSTDDGSSLFSDMITNVPRLIQRYALLALDYSAQGGLISLRLQKPRMSNRAKALQECSWSGVYCDSQGMVTGVAWVGVGFQGNLSHDVGLLQQPGNNFTLLDLADNALTGTLPESLYDLTNLEYLYLHQNQLHGSISDSISRLTNLNRVYLGDNRLTGSFPQGLFGSSSSSIHGSPFPPLRYLNLHSNHLQGIIPPELGTRLPSLYYLDLGRNLFSGPLPPILPTELRHLYLDHNRLHGSIPNLFPGQLQQLLLQENLLEGSFGEINTNGTNNLHTLELEGNALLQPLSDSVCSWSVFEQGSMTRLGSDCSICTCGEPFCVVPRCVA